MANSMNDTYIVAVDFLFLSELGYEKQVRRIIEWLFPQLGFQSDRVADTKTAVSEVCINAGEHGNQGRLGL